MYLYFVVFQPFPLRFIEKEGYKKLEMLKLHRMKEPMGLGGRDRYFQDQWDYFRSDLRAKDGEGWTDMELVGVDDEGDFCCVKVSVLFSLPRQL